VVASGDLKVFGVSLKSPKTGDVVAAGSQCEVNWTGTEGTAPVTAEIFYSNDSGASWASIAQSQPQSGSYLWTVPDDTTKEARIRVIETDSGSNTTKAESGDFTIQGPLAVTLIQPNGGESIAGGSTYEIKWDTSSGDNATVSLFYSTDSGTSYSIIVTNISDTGSYVWSVPSIDSTTVRVKAVVKDSLNRTAEDVSDADFTIMLAVPEVGGPAKMASCTGAFMLVLFFIGRKRSRRER